MAESSLLTARAPRVALVMACLFSTNGVVLPFLARWLEGERGLIGAQIGVVMALAQFGRIFTGPWIAHWADRVGDRRLPMTLLGAGALAAFAAFFFFAHSFWELVGVGFAALTLTYASAPLVEGALLRATATGKMPYGFGRALGSVSFIIANVASGALIARFGLSAVAAWTLTSLAAFALSSRFALPRDPAPPREEHATHSLWANIRALLRNRRYVILLVACGLIQCGHAFYYGFSTLVWRAQGISAETVGWLWACGVSVEVLFLMCLPFVERRVSPEALILIGGAGGAVRWTLLGLAPAGWILWPLQALHALTFAAAHVGAMRLLYRETPERSAALAQTLYAVSTSGVLMGASTLLSGVLYDLVGPRGYWAMAAFAALGGSAALLLLAPRVQPSVNLSTREHP